MRRDSPFTIDSTPLDAPSVPFASESGLQRFVEEHAPTLMGLNVIASSRRGGGKIDLLAIDGADRPFIIECKWDRVEEEALEQLERYRAALLSKWARFEQLVGKVRGQVRPIEETEPVLITIGYRYRHALLVGPQPAVCLAYTYHDIEFTDQELQERKPGRVSLIRAAPATNPSARHPKVNKKSATYARLQPLAAGLRGAFWAIDAKLLKLDGVVPTYGGKNFVRYRRRGALFAEAVIGSESIHWRVKCPKPPHGVTSSARKRGSPSDLDCGTDIHTASEATRVFAVLSDAHRRVL